jgi:hypothetical protein
MVESFIPDKAVIRERAATGDFQPERVSTISDLVTGEHPTEARLRRLKCLRAVLAKVRRIVAR